MSIWEVLGMVSEDDPKLNHLPLKQPPQKENWKKKGVPGVLFEWN